MYKVLLDARKINDGGIGTYIRNLISAFAGSDQISLSLLVPEIQSDLNSSLNQIINSTKPYSVSEYLLLARVVNSGAYDLFHVPHYTLPFCIKCPTVITLHDTIHLSAPEKWYYPLIARRLISSAVNRAKKVIIVSEASRAEMYRHFPEFNLQAEKFVVIDNAISADCKAFCEPSASANLNLPDGFILSVISQNKIHKGLLDLLLAYKNVRAKQKLPDLVLAGFGVQDFMNNNPELLKQYQEIGVQFLGQVSAEILNRLYQLARVFLMASRIEGFGLSVLEAKVNGCRVLSRPLPSIIEMLDNNDLVLADMTQAALELGLSDLSINFPLQNHREANQEILTRYSLENLATNTLELYRQAINEVI